MLSTELGFDGTPVVGPFHPTLSCAIPATPPELCRVPCHVPLHPHCRKATNFPNAASCSSLLQQPPEYTCMRNDASGSKGLHKAVGALGMRSTQVPAADRWGPKYSCRHPAVCTGRALGPFNPTIFLSPPLPALSTLSSASPLQLLVPQPTCCGARLWPQYPMAAPALQCWLSLRDWQLPGGGFPCPMR